MGDDDAHALERVEMLAQLDPQRHRAACVERRGWLVEQQYSGSLGERAGDRDPLRLPAGQLPRTPVGEVGDREPFEPGHPGAVRASLRRYAARAWPERDVVERRQVREEQMVLEDDTDAARSCGGTRTSGLAQVTPPTRDLALVDGHESGQCTQRRRLAGAVGTDQADDLAGLATRSTVVWLGRRTTNVLQRRRLTHDFEPRRERSMPRGPLNERRPTASVRAARPARATDTTIRTRLSAMAAVGVLD